MKSEQTYLKEPGGGSFLWALVAGILGFVLILFIVNTTYLETHDEEADAAFEARVATRLELEAGHKQVAESYAWVDKANGVVRIPIEQAKDRYVELARQAK